MPIPYIDPASASRLRFVFDDAVLSFDLAANATFADIARALAGLTPKYRRAPVAIDVTLALTPSGRIH